MEKSPLCPLQEQLEALEGGVELGEPQFSTHMVHMPLRSPLLSERETNFFVCDIKLMKQVHTHEAERLYMCLVQCAMTMEQ